MITLDELNSLSSRDFVSTLAGIFEHSPWVAERVAPLRPFTSRLQLLDAMRAAVRHATLEVQLILIRAHPRLGARGRSRALLTTASAREQHRAGLEACTDEDFAKLVLLNDTYAGKFSFPFILAVRGHDPASIIATFETRMSRDWAVEQRAALAEIDLIAGYRLADCVASPAGIEVEAMNARLELADDPAADSLVREWMLAAGLEVYCGADTLIGIGRGTAAATSRLLIGVHYDAIAKVLRYDGTPGFLIGIAVVQQLKQKNLRPAFDLVIAARPAEKQSGDMWSLIDADTMRGCTQVNAADIESLPALRMGGIDDRCLAIVRQGPASFVYRAGKSLDSHSLDRAASHLENYLLQTHPGLGLRKGETLNG